MRGPLQRMPDRTDKSVSDVATFAEVASKAAKGGLPPVHLWNPPFCGDLDMEICTDGSWYYQGTPIGRPAMVRLFSTILKREGDEYFLVTPVEKVRIRVQDAPFIAIDADISTDEILFTTNVGDVFTADTSHAILTKGTSDSPRPYVHVRNGLWALIDRKTFYRLAEAAAADAQGRLLLRSGGVSFQLDPLPCSDSPPT